MQENFIIYNEEYVLIKDILKGLKANTRAEIVFITDSEGHCIASTGDMEDTHLPAAAHRMLRMFTGISTQKKFSFFKKVFYSRML